MTILTMIKQQGHCDRISMEVPPNKKRRLFIAGFQHAVPDDEVAWLLAYKEQGKDGIWRNMFHRPAVGTLSGVKQANDDTVTAVAGLLGKLVEKGTLTADDAVEIQRTIPPVEARASGGQYLTRCESCTMKVKVSTGDEDCPHCKGKISNPAAVAARNAADGGAITTRDLPSPEDDAEPVAAEPDAVECLKCGYRPGRSGDPRKDQAALRQHMKVKHGSSEPADLP